VQHALISLFFVFYPLYTSVDGLEGLLRLHFGADYSGCATSVGAREQEPHYCFAAAVARRSEEVRGPQVHGRRGRKPASALMHIGVGEEC